VFRAVPNLYSNYASEAPPEEEIASIVPMRSQDTVESAGEELGQLFFDSNCGTGTSC